MYGHNHHPLMGYPYPDHFPLIELTAAHPNMSPHLLTTTFAVDGDIYHDPMTVAPQTKAEVGYSSGSGSGSGSSYGSPGGYSAQTPSLIQRSASEAELENSPVRRVFSAGDLQMNMVQRYHRSESPLSSESSSILESMTKACPYSPEEKKERIERYRSKRNQRNFTKKITYACRKTLADSRPRIRGRFAKNDEIEKSSQWSQERVEEEEEDEEEDDNWINFLDSFSANLIP